MKKNNKLAIRIEEESVGSPFSNQQGYFVQPLRPITLPDSDEDRINNEQPQNPSKVIEFEEFLIEDDKEVSNSKDPMESTLKPSEDSLQLGYTSHKHSLKSKRQFLIDIPECKSHRNQLNAESSLLEKEDYKQPPAPSNKKSFKAKNFVFPINMTQKPEQTSKRQQEQTNRQNIEELIRNFDKERQEFYRQKSNFEKQLLVKEGQIEMLQKMLTGRIGNEDHSILSHNYQYYESLILEKDLQINELLEKISELSKQLSGRGEELREVKSELNRLENVNESLLHQLYLLEKKEANKKTTQQFYDLKRQKATTPTARNWQYQSKKEELRFSGFSQIQKRLENLTINRVQFQDRKKIKSQLNYTQPARYKQNSYQIGYGDYSKGNKF